MDGPYKAGHDDWGWVCSTTRLAENDRRERAIGSKNVSEPSRYEKISGLAERAQNLSVWTGSTKASQPLMHRPKCPVVLSHKSRNADFLESGGSHNNTIPS